MMCLHLLFLLLHFLLWLLPRTSPLMWQRAFSQHEIAELLSHCTVPFLDRCLVTTGPVAQSGTGLTPVKAPRREHPVPCLPQPNFSIERFIQKDSAKCTAKDCKHKFAKNELVVSVSGLKQSSFSKAPVEVVLHSCLQLRCLVADRNGFYRIPDFNFSFQSKPSQLLDAEVLAVTLCTTRPALGPRPADGGSPAKRKSKKGKDDTDFQTPPKKRRP
jgi:hypothetical protein